jgi:cyclopropane fatty-acyl-phospholipid synthase-like methyltransferase
MNTIKNLKKYWNENHKNYSNDRKHSKFAEYALEKFNRIGKILDIGSGKGFDSEYFLSKGNDVTLLEISDEALNFAIEKFAPIYKDKVHSINKDYADGDLGLGNQEFDLVYSRLALHYFDKKTTAKVFKGIYDHLAKDGFGLIVIKSPADKKEMDFLKETAKELDENLFLDGEVIKSRFTKEQLEDILKDARIQTAEVSEYIETYGDNDVTKSGVTEQKLYLIKINK